jgi:hypothetical protein
MPKDNDIKNELLNQLDKDRPQSDDTDKNSSQKVINRYIAQLKRLKRATIISWIITLLYWLGMHNLKVFLLDKYPSESLLTKNEFMLYSYSDMGMWVLIVIAVLLSVSMYYKSKTLTMLQISVRLAGIEEQLKRLSEKE